jgi:hypothetical protein
MAKLNAKQLEKAHGELQADARDRVVERGLLQFRADADTVKAVLQAADERNMPVGALLRQWIQERLFSEHGKQKSPDLVQRVTLLEEAVTDLQQKLGPK